ncbi:MAG: hypothetical protein KatS3mg012_2576 [Gaiellaceae bacterium]|nr:MAG: hypothetical protein KatS3mg012_2576 [Gaiellaceae bacterium]
MRVREIAGRERERPPLRERVRLPLRRISLAAVPAAAALAVVAAGVVGISRSGSHADALRDRATVTQAAPEATKGSSPSFADSSSQTIRAQRVGATLTLEVDDPDAVSRAAQATLDLTRRLGGYVVSSSVATGEEGRAQLVVRVPVEKVQDAIVGLSGLGRIVAQQVTVDDLQEQLDALAAREQELRNRIARVRARLASEGLEPRGEAILRARLGSLRAELVGVRSESAATKADARMATLSVTVATPDAISVAHVPSRLDRALDEALNVLAWEGVVALAAAIVLAPLVLLGAGVWLARRLYRRRDDERLLAAP